MVKHFNLYPLAIFWIFRVLSNDYFGFLGCRFRELDGLSMGLKVAKIPGLLINRILSIGIIITRFNGIVCSVSFVFHYTVYWLEKMSPQKGYFLNKLSKQIIKNSLSTCYFLKKHNLITLLKESCWCKTCKISDVQLLLGILRQELLKVSTPALSPKPSTFNT